MKILWSALLHRATITTILWLLCIPSLELEDVFGVFYCPHALSTDEELMNCLYLDLCGPTGIALDLRSVGLWFSPTQGNAA